MPMATHLITCVSKRLFSSSCVRVEGSIYRQSLLNLCQNVFTHLSIPSFICLVRLWWNAHFVSSTGFVNTLSSARFAALWDKLRCSGVRWSAVMTKEEKKIVSRTSMTLGAREYSQDVLPEMICNRNCEKKRKEIVDSCCISVNCNSNFSTLFGFHFII